MPLRRSLVLCLILAGTLGLQPLVVHSPAADDADLRAKVKRLIEQLGDPDQEKQTAAETGLIQLGPDILPLLAEDKGLSPAQAKRLKTVRGILRDAQVQRDLAPRLFTLTKTLPLSKALEELTKQTGNQVMDLRQDNSDVDIKLDLRKVTFWQALDTIAKAADVGISLYEKEGQVVGLREGPYRETQVSYSGQFRIKVKRLLAVRDLEQEDAHYVTAVLEIAWEPRFQALLIDIQPESFEIQDDRGRALKVLQGGSGRVPVAGRVATEAQVRLEAPPRTAAKLGSIKGNLTMIGPSRMLTFGFDKLAKIEGGKPERKQTKDEVTVSIQNFVVESERWTVSLLLEYPSDGPEFESFESWLVNNKIHLEKDGGKIRLAPGAYNTGDSSSHKAIMIYHFVEESEKMPLGKPEDWKLVYQTPGALIKVPIKLEFKDVELP